MREKIKNIFNNKKIVISLTITLVLLLAVGATYAWWVWNSSDNTSVTIQIGNVASFYFPNGNSVDADITPIYNSCSEGLSIPFGVTNDYDATNKLMIMHVYFDIDYLPVEFQTTALKYQLLQEGTVIAEGNFSTYVEGDTITVDDYIVVPAGSSTFTFYICLDGNDENVPANPDDGVGGTLRPEIEIVDIYSNPEDWLYTLGTDQTTISSIPVNLDQREGVNTTTHQTQSVNISPSITIAEDEVLLTSYIGTNPDVDIADTMNINGTNYKVKLLTNTPNMNSAPAYFEDEYEIGYNAFVYNTNIETVLFGNNVTVVGYNEDTDSYDDTVISGLFKGCTNLFSVLNIPSGITNMNATFKSCISLENSPMIPQGVTDLNSTFYGDTSLINAPRIPNSVISLSSTFEDCTSLVTPPTIPNNVSNMKQTFAGCSSLMIPATGYTIPSSVRNISNTFADCTSLIAIGTQVINFSTTAATIELSNNNLPLTTFENTTEPITAQVASCTSTTAKYLACNKPSNVSIKLSSGTACSPTATCPTAS